MHNKRLKIAYICGYSEEAYGGVQAVVPQYLEHMSQIADVSILCVGTKKFHNTEEYEVISCLQDFEQRKFDIVVFHEVYYIKYYRIARKLILKGIKYVVIPHGSLTKEAQLQKEFLKRIFNSLYGNKFIRNASMIQFLSESEKQRSSQFDFRESCIVPNGIDTKKMLRSVKQDNSNSIKLLFIGRYSIFYKGLDVLLEACALIHKQLIDNKISLDIYGTDFENGKAQLEKIIEQYSLKDCVNLYDGIYDQEKEKVILQHNIFIQPSRSEGLPMGVLEAMEYGLPVIVTPGTSFDKLVLEYNCGWTTTVTAEGIARTILQAYEEREKLYIMSQNAIQLVKKQFDWNVIMEKTMEQYESLLHEKD